jgi:hypothetical protein
MGERIGKWLAYHEAGHAVARLALDRELPYPGQMVKRVSIVERIDQRIISSRGTVMHAIGMAEQDGRVQLATLPALMADPEYWSRFQADIEQRARMAIIESYAGPAAEGISRRWSKAGIYFTLCNTPDFTHPEDVSKLLPMGNLDALYDEAWRLMRRNWPSVKTVADAWWIAKELDGDEVERLAKL